jgi:hypothetical protein
MFEDRFFAIPRGAPHLECLPAIEDNSGRPIRTKNEMPSWNVRLNVTRRDPETV